MVVPCLVPEMRNELHNLHRYFEKDAVPAHGRYVEEPAVTDANGLLYVPPKQETKNYVPWAVAGAALGFAAIALLRKQKNKACIAIRFLEFFMPTVLLL